MSANITLGIESKTNKIKHITEVENGDKCNCVCIECGKALTAINNKNNKRDFHFRHKETSICIGGIETAIHLLAKQIIIENKEITITKNKSFIYTEAKAEIKQNNYQPDVITKNADNEWFIEIFVSNPVSAEKKEKIKKDNVNCLEIDLSNVDRATTPEELKPIVLKDISTRKVLNRKYKREYIIATIIIFIIVIISFFKEIKNFLIRKSYY